MLIYIVIGIVIIITALITIFSLLMFYRFTTRKKKNPVSVSKKNDKFFDRKKESSEWLKNQPFQEVCIKSHDMLTLSGRYIDVPNKKGIIIMVHGFHSSLFNDFACMIEFYIKLGYGILLPTQRAHKESEGKYIGFGVLERYDCLSWINYVNSRFGNDTRVFLMGLSMGASTVLMASGFNLPDNICGIIADCGFTSPYEIFRHVIKNKYHLPVFPFLYLINFWCRTIAGYSLKEYSTLNALEINKKPVLFIHGGRDRYVPPRMSYENYNACLADKKLIVVDDATHGTSYLTETQRVQDSLKEFLSSY